MPDFFVLFVSYLNHSFLKCIKTKIHYYYHIINILEYGELLFLNFALQFIYIYRELIFVIYPKDVYIDRFYNKYNSKK